MGYSHYWDINPETNEAKYKKALKDCVKIVEHGTKKGILAGWDRTGKPDIKNGLRFNGKAPEDYDTFSLPGKPMDVLKGNFVQKDKEGYVFNCCKTGRRPYDIYVTACLATMRNHLGGDFKISSDGEEEAFKEGQEFADEILKGIAIRDSFQRIEEMKRKIKRKRKMLKEVVLYEWFIDKLQKYNTIQLKTKNKNFDEFYQPYGHIKISDDNFNVSIANPEEINFLKSFKNLESAVNFCEKELIKAFNEDPENKNYKIMISRKMREK